MFNNHDAQRRTLYGIAVVLGAAAIISVPVANRAQALSNAKAAAPPLALVVHYDAVPNPFAIDAAVAPTPQPKSKPNVRTTLATRGNDARVPGIGALGPDGKPLIPVPGEILSVTVRPDGQIEAVVQMQGAREPITVRVGTRIGNTSVKRILIDEVALADGTILRPSTGDYTLESASMQPVGGGAGAVVVPGVERPSTTAEPGINGGGAQPDGAPAPSPTPALFLPIAPGAMLPPAQPGSTSPGLPLQYVPITAPSPNAKS